MDKPQPKREVAMIWANKTVRVIRLSASQDAAQEIEEFGYIMPESSGRYHLIVDPRYDFEEVRAYIENYG